MHLLATQPIVDAEALVADRTRADDISISRAACSLAHSGTLVHMTALSAEMRLLPTFTPLQFQASAADQAGSD
jgi:hypothetical protein